MGKRELVFLGLAAPFILIFLALLIKFLFYGGLRYIILKREWEKEVAEKERQKRAAIRASELDYENYPWYANTLFEPPHLNASRFQGFGVSAWSFTSVLRSRGDKSEHRPQNHPPIGLELQRNDDAKGGLSQVSRVAISGKCLVEGDLCFHF